MCHPINLVDNSLTRAVQTDQDTYLISFKISEVTSTGMKIKALAQPNYPDQRSFMLIKYALNKDITQIN